MGAGIRPMASTPIVDPRSDLTDVWVPASGFVKMQPAQGEMLDAPERITALARAASLTCEAAAEMAKLHPVTGEPDELARARAAGLHEVAARMRREAGAWADCRENFVALARYHAGIEREDAAEAYVNKAMFVSRVAGDDAVELDACLFAVSTFLDIGKFKEASDTLVRVKALGNACDDAIVSERVADAEARVMAALGSQGCERQMRTNWTRGPAPVEFELQAVVEETGMPPVAVNAPRAIPVQGIDLLMQHPGPAGECRYWVSHRVLDGEHRIVTLPNWSGRAMRAAKAIHDATKHDEDGTDGPSSVVLQVCCALEAYISAVVHFIREADHRRWEYTSLPRYCLPNDTLKKRRVNTMDKWKQVPKALFGENWIRKEDRNNFIMLLDLRDELVHFKGDNEERIELNDASDHPMAGKINLILKRPRPGPRPWVDRILTPELSQWAINVGETMIYSFRTAWEKLDEDAPGNASAANGANGPVHGFDPVEMEPGAGVPDHRADDVAELSRRARARTG